MAIEIPRNRLNIRQIQAQKRNIPLDQIIAVEGQNPVAQGIDVAGNVIGQTLQKRAELQRQGQELARLEQLAGQRQGSFSGLDPETARTFAMASQKRAEEQRANSYTPQQLMALNSGDPAIISGAFPQGVPERAASLAATIGSREENRAIRKEQMNRGFEDKRSREKTDIVSKFNTDPGVRKIQTSVDAASNVRELATSGNPIAANAIPTYMARASGEVGNLSEADKRPFGGSQAILTRLQAALTQQATGQMSEENREFVINLANTMEKSAIRNLDRRAQEVSGQYGEASDYLKPDEIYKALRPLPTKQLDRLPPPGTISLGGGFTYKVKK